MGDPEHLHRAPSSRVAWGSIRVKQTLVRVLLQICVIRLELKQLKIKSDMQMMQFHFIVVDIKTCSQVCESTS